MITKLKNFGFRAFVNIALATDTDYQGVDYSGT